MTRPYHCAGYSLFIAAGFMSLSGCQMLGLATKPFKQPVGMEEAAGRLNDTQVADVQAALARSMEHRGACDQARTAYEEALKRDPARADAGARLAVLYDRQGEFARSEGLHRKALAAFPDNADLRCNYGYSLCLQRRWAEAEAVLREAIEISPRHARAHNNLGLLLARCKREEEALAEFRKAGCSDVDAHLNLAFGLSLEGNWLEAQRNYIAAQNLDPTCTVASKGLKLLESAMARIDKGASFDESKLAASSRLTIPEPDPATFIAGRESPNRAGLTSSELAPVTKFADARVAD